MTWLVVLIPALSGVLALLPRAARKGPRRLLLLAAAVAHSGITVALIAASPDAPDGSGPSPWVGLDALGMVFLAVTSGLFLAVAVYCVGYLAPQASAFNVQRSTFNANRESGFIACLLFFLATMSLVCISHDMGLLWIAVEATTLVSAPLICFHRHHRSLEAMWKYLLICSVGIALALLGNFFLAFAGPGHLGSGLNVSRLAKAASDLDPMWLKAAFLMLLVGYGTKMGLAPMHSWLPDAHSEAPAPVSALLSGALLNCAFLGILRGHSILTAAGLGLFSGRLLIGFGLLSMGIAAAFLIGQTDYKRMLAYSSIEHMGILAMGIGLGGLASQGALLHAINHSLAKGWLFLAAGNLLFLYKTQNAADIRGLVGQRSTRLETHDPRLTVPVGRSTCIVNRVSCIVTRQTGVLWLAGFLAITGSVPFGLFFSELTILKGALDAGRWGIAAGYSLTLAVVFVAMARIVLPMVFGSPDSTEPAAAPPGRGQAAWSTLPILALCGVVLGLGLYVPPALWQFLRQAAALVGGY